MPGEKVKRDLFSGYYKDPVQIDTNRKVKVNKDLSKLVPNIDLQKIEQKVIDPIDGHIKKKKVYKPGEKLLIKLKKEHLKNRLYLS